MLPLSSCASLHSFSSSLVFLDSSFSTAMGKYRTFRGDCQGVGLLSGYGICTSFSSTMDKYCTIRRGCHGAGLLRGYIPTCQNARSPIYRGRAFHRLSHRVPSSARCCLLYTSPWGIILNASIKLMVEPNSKPRKGRIMALPPAKTLPHHHLAGTYNTHALTDTAPLSVEFIFIRKLR